MEINNNLISLINKLLDVLNNEHSLRHKHFEEDCSVCNLITDLDNLFNDLD